MKKTFLYLSNIIIILIIILSIVGIKRNNQYKKKLTTLSNTIIKNLEESNKCSSKIESVWINSIMKKEDSETDQYTKINNKFKEDFNDSLNSLIYDSNFRLIINSVKESYEKTNKLLKELKNPPIQWKNTYNKIKNYYTDYESIIKLCTKHSGNYDSYKNRLDNALIKTKEIKKNIKIKE